MDDNIAPRVSLPDVIARVAALKRGSVVLILGESDTGKSTFVRQLATGSPQGHTALIDTDVGQGSLGPPGTIGAALLPTEGPLGAVGAALLPSEGPLGAVGAALLPSEGPLGAVGAGLPGSDNRPRLLGLSFIGGVSPIRHFQQICQESARLVALARAANPDIILVDTCGLVRGHGGRSLKIRVIQTVSPTVIIALSNGDELEAILETISAPPLSTSNAHGVVPAPIIWRVQPSPDVHHKTPSFRRHRREARFAEALAGAAPRQLSIDVSDPRHREFAAIFTPQSCPSEAQSGLLEAHSGLLAGLLDAQGFCAGIGLLEHIDIGAGTITIQTALPTLESVRTIRFGDIILDLQGRTIGERNAPPVQSAGQEYLRLPPLYVVG